VSKILDVNSGLYVRNKISILNFHMARLYFELFLFGGLKYEFQSNCKFSNVSVFFKS